MKIVKIFGFVVAVHAAVFILIFAIPGCRSSARKASAGGPPPGSADVAYAGGPAATPTGGDSFAAPRPVGINATDTSGASGIRFSPTRPGSTAAAPVAAAPEPAPAVSYTVVKGDSLWSVAKKNGVTVAELAAANDLPGNAALKLGQKLVIPSTSAASLVTGAAAPVATGAASPAAPSGATRRTYTVQSGDNLGAIARRHGTTVAALKSTNRLSSDILRPGQSLVLPAGSTGSASTSASTPTVSAAVAPAPSRASGASVRHTVAPGETIGAIARQYGVRTSEINVANNISDPRTLQAGQVLIIPGWQAPGSAAAPAASTPDPVEAAPQTPPAQNTTPTVNLIIPGAEQALPSTPTTQSNIPVIRVEEPTTDDGAPRIE